MSETLLDAIINAGAQPETEVRATAPTKCTHKVRTDDGIEWLVDDATGLGRRLTPIAGRRSLSSKPPVVTKQFAPLVSSAERDWRATFSKIAADPLKSSALVTLIAANPSDRSAALNLLGTQWKSTEAERDMIVEAYLELMRRR